MCGVPGLCGYAGQPATIFESCRILSVDSQARSNQPQCGSLTESDPHWGWLGLACETTLSADCVLL